MSSTTTDLSKVWRAPDGLLRASGLVAELCGAGCCVHIGFKDQDGRVFVVGAIKADIALQLGFKLFELHDAIAGREGKPLVRQ